MSLPNSPSPKPRPMQPLQREQQLPNSPILPTPSFSSTLPLPRPIRVPRRSQSRALTRKDRLDSSQRSCRTRSFTSSFAHNSDGSLRDFSVENYTVDLAQLRISGGGARPLGFEQAFHGPRNNDQNLQEQEGDADADNEGGDGYRDEEADHPEDNPLDFMKGYEVDLGGLGEKPSSLLVDDVVDPGEEVPSEDEGPEDFTQNMEVWMRGTKTWRRGQDQDVAENYEPDPEPEQNLPAPSIEAKGAEEESVFEPLGTSTPALLRNHGIIEEGVEKEVRLRTPPLSRLNTEMLQNKAAEEVFDRISALQAEVESMRLEDEARRTAYQALEGEHTKMRKEYERVREDDQEQYNALRSEHDKSQLSHREISENLRRENKDLTQEYNNVIKQLRVLEMQATSEQGLQLEKLRAQNQPAVQELEVLKIQAEAERNSAKAQIESLTGDLEVARNESGSCRSQIESMREANATTVKNLMTELDARTKEVAFEREESIARANEAASLAETNVRKDTEVSELRNQVKAIKVESRQAQEQLVETRRIVQTIEDENDRLLQQSQRQVEEIAKLKSMLNCGEITDIGTVPTQDKQTTFDEDAHKAIIQEMTDRHDIHLISLGADHAKEIQTLRKALLKAGEGMQKREARIAKAHQDQVASLEQQITTLRQQHDKALESSSAMEIELRSAIRVLTTKLERAKTSQESARLEVEEARQQADDAQQANAIVNAELESRFIRTVEEREEEWRRRIDILLKDREKMGKALMWAWGREELGPKAAMDREQGYRYRFSRKA